MAVMIPNVDPQTIKNNGEHLFYEMAVKLPKEYTVLYSYKYKQEAFAGNPEAIREADFVIVHPALGYLVIEVKQGEVIYRDGQWQAEKNGVYAPLKKNPVEQASSAMYAILKEYKHKAETNYFPLKIKYAIAFPECNSIAGDLPGDLDNKSIFLNGDLTKLEEKILTLFEMNELIYQREAIDILLNQILAPSFKIFTRLDEEIEMFNRQAERILTTEQKRILDETELDKKKIFFGFAGTGKTFLAMEKAKRLTRERKKVFLTCFNKNLAEYMKKNLPSEIITSNFHDYLLRTLHEQGLALTVPEQHDQRSRFFNETLPDQAFDYFASLPEKDKFDAVIVDEGQDFREEWYACLDSMAKHNCEFYIFADASQSLFDRDSGFLKKLPHSMHRLTRNLRNTEPINNWMSAYLPPNQSLISTLQGGLPVSFFPWQDAAEEKRLIEKEVGRLVSQGIKPKRIVILSPNIREKSSLADIQTIKVWPIGKLGDSNPNAIQFSTIRSFKGLEADIVFLIGIKAGSPACTPADIYVGGSRARFLLHVFHERTYLPENA
ncbi:MAG: NERD domain-containing protein [Clostridiales bacterium]|jgi:hypothetical protein|nr:NERD domain-containing protein [Clostridiales bacterium]